MQNVLEELAVQMRDPKRIDVVLGEVAKFWKAHPDLRFIQMMNAIDFSGRFTEKRVPEDLFFLEDDAFLDIMRGINEEYENR